MTVSPTSGREWREVDAASVAGWNDRLLGTGASLFQYPYWNEPFRRMHFRPRYLVYPAQGEPEAFVCVLSFGIPGFRIGLVRQGPASLTADPMPSPEALQALVRWATKARYVFLRFSHRNASCLEAVSAAGASYRVDSFPFHRDGSEDLIVEQVEDEEKMLASLHPTARRKIRKCAEVDYEFEFSDSPEAFQEQIWPLFMELSKRKGFKYRPLASYLDLIRLGQPHGRIGLYVARLKGRVVEALLIVSDGSTALYMSGALDVDALGDSPSPSCSLHWWAMRDSYRRGAKFYNLGTRSGNVYQFKKQFRPVEIVTPMPVTIVLRRGVYSLWSAMILRVAIPAWPHIRRLGFA